MYEKAFVRDKNGRYFSAAPKVTGSHAETMVSWTLKEIGKTEKIVITTRDLALNYETCSPYEALGTIIQ